MCSRKPVLLRTTGKQRMKMVLISTSRTWSVCELLLCCHDQGMKGLFWLMVPEKNSSWQGDMATGSKPGSWSEKLFTSTLDAPSLSLLWPGKLSFKNLLWVYIPSASTQSMAYTDHLPCGTHAAL